MHFYTLLTKRGEEKIAQAALNKTTIDLKSLVVGDGNGVIPIPNKEQTSLENQVYEVNLSQLTPDSTNKNWLVTTAHIPADEGNFWIREVGIKDSDGDLIAVGNYPETYKPVLENGVAKDLLIKLMVAVSSMDNITLTADSKELMATKEYVDTALASKHTGFKNLLINGDFRIWQRGESFQSKSQTVFTADRWNIAGLEGINISKSLENKELYFLHSEITALSLNYSIRQRIEFLGKNKNVTLSFCARVKTVNNSIGTCQFFNQAGVTVLDETFELSNEWKRFSFSFSTLDWKNNREYSELKIIPEDMVHHFDLADVQLEFGNQATSFEYRPYGLELSLCQWYYERQNEVMQIGQSNTSNGVRGQLKYVRKRIIPSISTSDYGFFNDNSVSIQVISVSITGMTKNTARFDSVMANTSLADRYICLGSAFHISIDAEIY